MRHRSALPLLLFLVLPGCVSHRDLATSAVSFNLAVEEAQNQMLLLNAIRASQRRPMYITGIQSVTGSVGIESSAGFEIPFGKGSGQNAASPGVTYTDNPTFEVPVFETQEFMNGFLRPIEPALFAYYWDMGWPRGLLIHLLVERLRISLADGEKVLAFENYPDAEDESHCEISGFSWIVDQLVWAGNPVLVVSGFGGSEKVSLRISEDGALESAVGEAIRRHGACHPGTVKPPSERGPEGRIPIHTAHAGIELDLRSPEAVLYYLGEIVRFEEAQTKAPVIRIWGSGEEARYEPVFVARTLEAGCATGSVMVRYGGISYLIPERQKPAQEETPTGFLVPLACNGGRSMQSLSLVSQIIAIQKSAQDMPGTTLVRTIGN